MPESIYSSQSPPHIDGHPHGCRCISSSRTSLPPKISDVRRTPKSSLVAFHRRQLLRPMLCTAAVAPVPPCASKGWVVRERGTAPGPRGRPPLAPLAALGTYRSTLQLSLHLTRSSLSFSLPMWTCWSGSLKNFFHVCGWNRGSGNGCGRAEINHGAYPYFHMSCLETAIFQNQ
jgi:hypothetical protein